MTNDPVYDHLRELSWRRKLTPAEESQLRAWLAAHPEAQADWETEARLNEMLGALPDAPMPSNFIARVVQAVERDAVAEQRKARRSRLTWWRRLVTRAALAGFVGAAGFVWYREFHEAHMRAEVKSSLAAVSELPPMPSP